MNRRCEYAWRQQDLSTLSRSITTKRWWRLAQRLAGKSRSKVTNQSRAESIPCVTRLEYLLKESLDSNDQLFAIRTFVCVSFVDE